MVIPIGELIYYLNIHRGSVISVVGSGGKTTLIEGLASGLKDTCRVCIGATTKIQMPKLLPGVHVVIREELQASIGSLQAHEPGIYYAVDQRAEGLKLHGFSEAMYTWAKENTDVILLEADGSKMLPLKGWANYEPVIIPQTEMTIGVMPVFLLGQPVNPGKIHRFKQFSELTGVRDGEILRKEHLLQAILSPRGLFGKAVGEKVLFFSQVNNDIDEANANAIADQIPEDFIEKIVIGSIRP